jgi:hypothetical protein
MSIRAVLSCNGKEGIFECRQATPVGEVMTARQAREVAHKIHGWSSEVISTGGPYLVFDFCHACTKRRETQR